MAQNTAAHGIERSHSGPSKAEVALWDPTSFDPNLFEKTYQRLGECTSARALVQSGRVGKRRAP
jgi:hypothetical protein